MILFVCGDNNVDVLNRLVLHQPVHVAPANGIMTCLNGCLNCPVLPSGGNRLDSEACFLGISCSLGVA